MEGEVEVLVVHPDRGGEPCGNPTDTLPVPRHERDALADQRNQPLVVEALSTGVENVDSTDVARSVDCIQGQQGNLERCEPLWHMGRSCSCKSLEPSRYYRPRIVCR